MKQTLKFSIKLLLTGGVIMLLQTGCSKEKSADQASNPIRKSAPTELSRTHQDVLDFKEQYDLYANEQACEFPTLTLDDAEWMLEAAFNYDHRIANPSEVEYWWVIYEEAAYAAPFTIGEYEGYVTVSSSTLFDLYSHLLAESTAMENMAPLSDLEAEFVESGTARLKVSFARLDIAPGLPLPYPTLIPYKDYQRSTVTSESIKNTHWVGNIPWCYGGQVSQYWSWEQLTNNLNVTSSAVLPGLPAEGYYQSITFHDYGRPI